MTRVLEIWRFPVKSIAGETLEAATVGPMGIEGDRAWGITDLETGLTLTARREPRLLFASARVDAGSVVLTLPDGTETTDDEVLSSWLERPVALQKAGPEDQGTFEISLAEDEQTDWVQWTGGAGSFHDSGARRLTIVAEASMRDWDRRRFRLNVITDGEIGSERPLYEHKVKVGGCVIDIVRNVDRCVVVTRPQPDGIERDLTVLKTINAELEGNLGVGGTIDTPGHIAVGDEVTALG